MPQEIIARALGNGLAHDADATLVAESTTRAMRSLLRELQPLVGELATAALYKRSVHLAKSSFRRPLDNANTSDELLATLEQELKARASEDAQRAATAILNSLVDLLVSLIGEALTNRLLRKAWEVEAQTTAISKETPQ